MFRTSLVTNQNGAWGRSLQQDLTMTRWNAEPFDLLRGPSRPDIK